MSWARLLLRMGMTTRTCRRILRLGLLGTGFAFTLARGIDLKVGLILVVGRCTRAGAGTRALVGLGGRVGVD
jgi:hypothetical protein